jgi:hypothetical protein
MTVADGDDALVTKVMQRAHHGDMRNPGLSRELRQNRQPAIVPRRCYPTYIGKRPQKRRLLSTHESGPLRVEY